MATVRHHIRIDAPADKVWGVIRDAGRSPTGSARSPRPRPPRPAGGDPGDGTVIDEDILTNDDTLRRFQYTIKSGLPVEHHIGTFDVLEDGRAPWSSTPPMSDPTNSPRLRRRDGPGHPGPQVFCEK